MNPEPQIIEYRPRDYLSYSTLMSFCRCPRKYFYEKCGIYPHDEAIALHYGTAMHRAVSTIMEKGIAEAHKDFMKIWSESGCAGDDKRNPMRALDQLSHFYHTHVGDRSIYRMLPPVESNVVLPEDVSPNEIVFALDVGLRVPIVGRLDGWCEHRDSKDAYAYEFKTTSRLTSNMFDSLELNPQVLTYALVTKTMTGRDIKGVMFEAMLIDKTKVDNITHPVPIQEHMLDDILIWLRYMGELLLSCEDRLAAGLTDAFPKNFSGCSAYPMFYQTGSKCEYENLCRVPKWQDMVRYFQIRPEHKMIDLTVKGTKPGEVS